MHICSAHWIDCKGYCWMFSVGLMHYNWHNEMFRYKK